MFASSRTVYSLFWLIQSLYCFRTKGVNSWHLCVALHSLQSSCFIKVKLEAPTEIPRQNGHKFPLQVPGPQAIYFLFIYFFFCFLLLGPHVWHMEVLRLNWSCGCQPKPQPQQHMIWATTYTTAHSNARSLTHWARAGIELTSSWVLVGFISTVPQWELPEMCKRNISQPACDSK